MPDEEVEVKSGSVWLGFAIGAALDILAVPLLIAINHGPYIFGIGILQLVWIAPAYFIVRRMDFGETAKGIMIAGGICFLLNAACWGLLLGAR